MFGNGEEFREGDRAWAGASILELPDLSSIHLEARLDESDRGRLKIGQDAIILIEAVPGNDFTARIDQISMLARVDFSVGLAAGPRTSISASCSQDLDPQIRPGMTAVARIATDRLPDVDARPVRGDFPERRPPVVYRLVGLEVRRAADRRSSGAAGNRRSSAAGVNPGDRVATRRPGRRSDQESRVNRA